MILSTLGEATKAAPASPKPVTVRQRSGWCPQALSTSLIMAVKYLLKKFGQNVEAHQSEYGNG